RSWFRSTGTPDWIGTFDLVTLPYPTRFGLYRAAMSPVPFVTLTHRMLVIRWREPDGHPRTLLFEPTDTELARRTPYFARLSERTPDVLERLMSHPLGDVITCLHRVGIQPADVDYITFDHLHTQDVRRWIGTASPAMDISPAAPVQPLLPNARLVVQRAELESLRSLHPLQLPWYQPHAYTDLRSEAITPIDGRVLLGHGATVQLVRAGEVDCRPQPGRPPVRAVRALVRADTQHPCSRNRAHLRPRRHLSRDARAAPVALMASL